jgi:hypothetical protein
MQDLAWLKPASPHPRHRAKVFWLLFFKKVTAYRELNLTPTNNDAPGICNPFTASNFELNRFVPVANTANLSVSL